MRVAASSAVSGSPSKVSTVNIRPFERLPLCGMASTSAAGLLLERLPCRSRGPRGSCCRTARTAASGSATLGVAAEEHVAVQVVAADRGPLEADDRGEGAGVVVAVGERGVGLPGVADRRLALDRRLVAGERADDLHRRGEDPCRGRRWSARRTSAGRPRWRAPRDRRSRSCGIRPYISAWSEITRKSSGRESLARRPPVEVTSSPRAKRKASSWPSRFIVPASTEIAVCRWVSPNSGRVGKLRPA